MVTTRSPKTIVKPTALGPVANTDTKLLIYGLFQKGRVLAQDGIDFLRRTATAHSPLMAQSSLGANLAVLRKLEDHAVILNDPSVIKEWRLDQVITSDL